MGLNLAIIPTLRSGEKPPIVTSLGFAACVTAIGWALLAGGLWLGAGANILGGALWATVVIQTWKGRRINFS